MASSFTQEDVNEEQSASWALHPTLPSSTRSQETSDTSSSTEVIYHLLWSVICPSLYLLPALLGSYIF